jgi:hypothetical protein
MCPQVGSEVTIASAANAFVNTLAPLCWFVAIGALAMGGIYLYMRWIGEW